ncbi:MAG: hypothetical protein OHK0029_09730 [Armatimonadaceae bacterium]
MKTKKLASILAVMMLSVLFVQGCNKTEAPPDPRSAAQKAEAEWFNQKARELGGNFDALSPDDKMRAIRFVNGSESQARTGFGMAAKTKAP